MWQTVRERILRAAYETITETTRRFRLLASPGRDHARRIGHHLTLTRRSAVLAQEDVERDVTILCDWTETAATCLGTLPADWSLQAQYPRHARLAG